MPIFIVELLAAHVPHAPWNAISKGSMAERLVVQAVHAHLHG